MSKKKKIVIPTEDEVAQYGLQRQSVEQDKTSPQEQSTEQTEPAAQADETQPAAEPQSEADQWKEKCLRAKADLLNYQRRAEKDRSDALRYANAGLAKTLLPILDDLERVVAAESNQPTKNQALTKGVKLTLENFLKVLRDFNIVPIEAVDKPFDPQVHEAVMENSSVEHPQRMVLEEVTKGYQLHDRVLRPAKVIVSKQSKESEDTVDDKQEENTQTD